MPTSPALCCQLDPSHLVPNQESLCPFCSIRRGCQTVATGAKKFANESKRGQKALGMAGRLKTPHGPFPVSRGLMRVFCPIIQALVLPVFDSRQHLLLGCPIALQLIGNDHPWDVLTPFQEFSEELLGGGLIPSALDQDVEGAAMLINRSPQVGRRAVDGKKNFIEVPLVAWLGTTTAEFIGVLLPELACPAAHRFVA